MAQIGTACKNYPNKKHGSTAGNSCWAVLSFFSLSAGRPSAGRRDWLDAARQSWPNFDLFQGNPIVLLLFSLSAGRPLARRRDWFGVAGRPVRLSSVFSRMAVHKLAHFSCL